MLNEVALWKRVALPILESYNEATDGSFIQNKESAVVWHFNNADPDFGNWQVRNGTPKHRIAKPGLLLFQKRSCR
jgi:trehalose-6-phosphatase